MCSVESAFEVVHMDEFIDQLLHEERCVDIILPRIQVNKYITVFFSIIKGQKS